MRLDGTSQVLTNAIQKAITTQWDNSPVPRPHRPKGAKFVTRPAAVMRRTHCMGEHQQPVNLRIHQCNAMSGPWEIAEVWREFLGFAQHGTRGHFAGTVDDPTERLIFWGNVPAQWLPGGATTRPGALILKLQLLHPAEGDAAEFDGRQVEYTACFHVDESLRRALVNLQLVVTVLGRVTATAEPQLVDEPEVVCEAGFHAPVVRFTTRLPYELGYRSVGYGRSDLVLELLPRPGTEVMAA